MCLCSLQNNNISSEGSAFIAEMLSHNASLEILQ
jgi:hypothetical protein